MRSSVTTVQGQAWDQLAKAKYGSEKQMDVLLPENVAEADTLLFAGGMEVALPDVRPQAVKSVPPWERM